VFGVGQKNALVRFIFRLRAGFSVGKNRIHQKYEDDCAIACLAMLLDLPYRSVRAVVMDYFENTLKIPFRGLDYKDDKVISARLGADITAKRVSRKNRRRAISDLYGVRAILEVPALDGSDDLHAVFWDGYELFDPAGKNNKRYAEDGTMALWTMKRYEVLNEEKGTDSIEKV
jgi:hypothetical protein